MIKECNRHNVLVQDHRQEKAFTLVELLVVIAIIALLVSILLPALSRAKEQARTMICLANVKQIGMITALYHAENENYLPVVFNQWMGGLATAKNNLLSMALRQYSAETRSLPDENGDFSPHGTWNRAIDQVKLREYYDKVLPEHFQCPFVRGTGPFTVKGGTRTEGIYNYNTPTFEGIWESYMTSMQEYGLDGRNNLGNRLYSNAHHLGLPHGRPKYGMFAWYDFQGMAERGEFASSGDYRRSIKNNITWDGPHAKKVGTGSLDQAVVVWCGQGEWSSYFDSIYNWGSHRNQGLGGTSAVFADTHAEWVVGSQIGWP